MQMSSKKKVFAVVITTAALTVGSFGAATAATKATRVSKTTVTTIANQAASGKLGRGAELTALLSALVTKGTITQAQADAIIAAHTAAEAARDALRPPKGPGGDKASMDERLAVIAKTLGIDTTTVLSRLKAGETLATIAGAKKDALISALVADETKRIDAAVTAGKLTAAQATQMKANLVAHVTDEVNSTRPIGPKMDDRGGKGGRGHGGHGGPKGGMKGGPSGAPTIPAPAATTASNA
jgi:polyhydroxyalkanoate synthesis regulator phasin